MSSDPLIVLHGLDAYPLGRGHVLWRNPAQLEDEPGLPASDEAFVERFALALHAPPRDGVADPRRVAVGAEYYGGMGAASNRGAGRVVNAGAWQVKGVGPTPLAAAKSGFLHSYGALTACEAAYETVYTRLAERLLPFRAAAIAGIILLDPKGAYYDYVDGAGEDVNQPFRCWSALAVRRVHWRPAHAMPASFVQSRPHDPALYRDIGRVRIACRALARVHGKEGASMMLFLANFYNRVAAQFACARANGLAHGTVSASNFSVDGAWLDLARSTFVPRCDNNGAFVGAAEEHAAALSMCDGFARVVHRFCRTRIDTQMLRNLFKQRYADYLNHYLLAQVSPMLAHDTTRPAGRHGALTTYLRDGLAARAVNRSFGPVRGLPSADAFTRRIETLFLDAARGGSSDGADWPCGAAPVASYHELLRSTYTGPFSGWSTPALVRHAACCGLRREYLKDLFVKKPLDDCFRAAAIGAGTGQLHLMFTSCMEVADWGFAADGALPLIWKEDRWSMRYACDDGSFVVVRGNEKFPLTAAAAVDFIGTHCTPAAFAAPASVRRYAARLIGFLGRLSP